MNNMRSIVIALVSVVVVAVSDGRAALSPLGGEFPLLGDVSGHQKNPNVALGQSGGFVVWQNMAPDGLFERAMIQRLSSDMKGDGVPVQLNQSNSQSNELNPRVAMLTDTGAAAVWEAGTRANTDIFLRILNSSGNFLTGVLPVNSNTAGIQRDADVAVLTNGNVVVVWSSEGQDGDGSGIYAQLFTSGGARIGGEFQVNGSTSMNQSDPAVAAMSEGRFVAAWVTETANGRTGVGAPNLRGAIMGRVFGASGGAFGNEYGLTDKNTLATAPVLASHRDGGFLAAWVQRDEENTRNLNDVYIRSFNSSGLPVGESERHNTHLKGQQAKPELVQLAGDALVAWTSYGQDASGAGIQGRLASGGTEFQVNSQGRLHQNSPTVATDGKNKFLAVWVNTIRPNHSILSAQRYVTTDGELAGVVDVTAGDARIVEAEPGSQLTGVTTTPAPQPQTTEASGSLVTAVSSTPSVARTSAPAASSVTATSAPAAPTPPTPAQAAAPNSLASARAKAPSAASRRIPQQPSSLSRSSVMAGRSMMQRMAQNRSLGRPAPSYGGRATQMARGSRSSLGQFNRSMTSRSLPGQGIRRGVGTSATQPSRSLASMRSGPVRRTAASAMSARSRPSQRTSRAPVQASLQRGQGGGYNLSWQSAPGARYSIQQSNDLRTWTNKGATRSGRSGTDSVQVGGGSGGARYYRVVRTN